MRNKMVDKDTESTRSEHRKRRKEHTHDRNKDRDRNRSSRPKDGRDNDNDNDNDNDDDRSHRRHRSSRSSRKTRSASSRERERHDRDRDRDRESEPASRDDATARLARSNTSSARKMAIVPELERRSSLASTNESRTSLPYPSFSKAHSKESVRGTDEGEKPRVDVYTPEPTDLGPEDRKRHAHEKTMGGRTHGTVPPSPPLTAMEPDLKRSGSGASLRKTTESTRSETDKGRRSTDSTSTSRVTATPKGSASKSSLRQSVPVDEISQLTADTEYSKPSTVRKEKPRRVVSEQTRPLSPNGRPPGRPSSAASHRGAALSKSSISDSDATSVAPDRKTGYRRPPALVSDAQSAADSSPRTPVGRDPEFPAVEPDDKGATPVIDVFTDDGSSMMTEGNGYANHGNAGASGPPPPPPPPPPAPTMTTAPRVDYLLLNGGLPHPVPRNLLAAATNRAPVLTYQQYASPKPNVQGHGDVASIFAPFQNLLDSYNQVMDKNGSLAVATGYRSVARRLLDRLEAVFARNISSEWCPCIMCRSKRQNEPTTEDSGVNWGDILEYVSGRRELPQWPPFTIEPSSGLGIEGGGREAPMQKLDIDVPEEYREHYVRQSKKTKSAVQKWLQRVPEEPTTAPQEFDDDTLTFAMLTHLEPENRPLFTALLRGLSTLPASRAPTPLNVPTPEHLQKVARALQRLYRLSSLPRDPECAMYLLKNPDLHNVLVTLAAVSSGEWEILISGRFDGFLWSGAEDIPPAAAAFNSPTSRGPSRGPNATPLSRTTTPFSMTGDSRGPTPFSPAGRNGAPSRGPAASPAPAPVQMDEETEIAVLAEVEREIYLGMEALEDAFEGLHAKAETVRRALRERSAGLAMAAQARRRGGLGGGGYGGCGYGGAGAEAEAIQVRMGTPASAMWESETDDGGNGWWCGAHGAEDGRSEIAPDDSASNVSGHRRRRRGKERDRVRTPALVLEEEEEEGRERGWEGAGLETPGLGRRRKK